MTADLKALEDMLRQTFDDYTLSQGEKFALQETMKDVADNAEALHFMRNRAFEIVKQQMRTSTQHHFEAVKWLEKVVKLLDVVQPAPKTHSEAWFSPGTDCADAILGAIASARHTIQVCVFTISDDRISHALLDAHHRNVRVRVITDDEKALDMGSDVHWLQKKGIPVKYDNDPGHMHHKFAVFDGQVVIHGSFNWTRSASTQNWEDISVQEDATLVTAFAQHFEYLWHTF